MGPHEFLDCQLALAVKYRFSTTSGLRSLLRNIQVRGHINSRHLFFLAVDCVLDVKTNAKQFARDARRLGLKAILEKDHIHIQTP